MNIKQYVNNNLITTDGKVKSVKIRWLKQKTPEIWENIKTITDFLNNPLDCERIYCILNDITDVVVCKCGKPVKYSRQKRCYNQYCSMKCTRLYENYRWDTGKTTYKNTVIDIKLRFFETYNTNNYTLINIDIVKIYISTLLKKTNMGVSGRYITTKQLRDDVNILCTIIKMTDFINFTKYDIYNWSERFYCIMHNMDHVNNCISCGSVVSYINYKTGYSKTCGDRLCTQKYAIEITHKNHYKNVIETITKQFKIINNPCILNDGKFTLQCKTCNIIDDYDLSNGKWKRIRCHGCMPGSYSVCEKELYNYINNIIPSTNNYTFNEHRYGGRELDIYIPSKNIAIEYNGLYWHSEQNGKDKSYHLNKTTLCESKSIRLIHVFEDEWLYKEQIVKNRLRSILGETKYSIYARKCEVREIPNTQARTFIDKYHIQGYVNSPIRLGLFYNNRMVACMTFGKRRFDKKDGFELVRYCTVANFRVLGGAGKLLKHFERNWNPTTLISYADRRWSQGGVYKSLGFEFVRNSTPNYWYFKHSVRYNRIQFQKHKLKEKLTNFDPNLTEYENMKLNGYDRIWDCGNMVFEKKY